MRSDQCEICGGTVTPINEKTCDDCGKRTCEECGRTTMSQKQVGNSLNKRVEIWQCLECEFGPGAGAPT